MEVIHVFSIYCAIFASGFTPTVLAVPAPAPIPDTDPGPSPEVTMDATATPAPTLDTAATLDVAADTTPSPSFAAALDLAGDMAVTDTETSTTEASTEMETGTESSVSDFSFRMAGGVGFGLAQPAAAPAAAGAQASRARAHASTTQESAQKNVRVSEQAYPSGPRRHHHHHHHNGDEDDDDDDEDDDRCPYYPNCPNRPPPCYYPYKNCQYPPYPPYPTPCYYPYTNCQYPPTQYPRPTPPRYECIPMPGKRKTTVYIPKRVVRYGTGPRPSRAPPPVIVINKETNGQMVCGYGDEPYDVVARQQSLDHGSFSGSQKANQKANQRGRQKTRVVGVASAPRRSQTQTQILSPVQIRPLSR